MLSSFFCLKYLVMNASSQQSLLMHLKEVGYFCWRLYNIAY